MAITQAQRFQVYRLPLPNGTLDESGDRFGMAGVIESLEAAGNIVDLFETTWLIDPTWLASELPVANAGSVVAAIGSYTAGFLGANVDPVVVVEVDLGTPITNINAITDPPINYQICDRTGFKIAVDEPFRMEWSGQMVRKRSLESRHPQDHLHARGTELQKGSPAGEGDDTFLDTNEVKSSDL